MLALYLLGIALGAVIVVVAVLAYGRFASLPFRHLALLAAGATVVLLSRLLVAWAAVAHRDPAPFVEWLAAVINGIGFGLVGWFGTALVLSVGRPPVLPLSTPVSALLGSLMAAAGVFQVFAPGPFAELAVNAGLALLIGGGMLHVASHREEIADPHVRSLVRTFKIAAPVLVLVVAAQVTVGFLPSMPADLRDHPLAQIVVLLAIEGIFIGYSLRYLFPADPSQAPALPTVFLARYGISARESEIVLMMLQGYSNRLIGEKLFISAATVKNHIYHIYRKTQARNKVQLVNLVRETK
jgi:DNA-binding CsgD family transcriptional regulator